MASSFEPLFAAPPGGDRRAEPRSPAAWFNQLGEGGGFRPAARYSPSPVAADEPDPADAIMADLLADAEARGRQAALAQMASEGAARAALKLSLEQWAKRQSGSLGDEPQFTRGHRIDLLEDALRPLRGRLAGSTPQTRATWSRWASTSMSR